MFETWKNVFKQEDLKKRIVYTIIILVLYRLGSALTVRNGADFLSYLNIMTGGALENATIFSMSITPYINASIIIQLLTIAIEPLERLAKEGGESRKKLQAITRYTTLGLALVQAVGFYFMLRNTAGVLEYR